MATGRQTAVSSMKLTRNSLKEARANARVRKRAFSIEYVDIPRVRTTWDFDDDKTNAIMEDVGVSVLDDDTEVEMQEVEQSLAMASPVSRKRDLIPPCAPKVTVIGNPGAGLQMIVRNTDDEECDSQSKDLSPSPEVPFFIHRRSKPYFIRSNAEFMDKLSDEIMLCIFCWLPKTTLSKCARVCKRWSRLAFDESLWKRLDLASKNLKAGVLGRILERGVSVLRLARSSVLLPLFSPSAVPNVRQCKLQYLDLSMSTITKEGIEELLSNCHSLKKLSLENCDVNEQICRAISQNANLEVLNLCMCRGITENGLVYLCNNLQRLESLNVAWSNMSRGTVVYLVICLPESLLKLNLSGCRQTLLDEDVKQLCMSCPNLKELDLSDATMLSTDSIEFISTLLKGLEYIALSRCYNITPASLPLLGNILTLLALDVFGVLNDTGLRLLRSQLSNTEVNKFPFSSIARPTTGIRRTSIWGLRVRDAVV